MISICLVCFQNWLHLYFILFIRGRFDLPARRRSHHYDIKTVLFHHSPNQLYVKVSHGNIDSSLKTLIVKLSAANSGQNYVNTDLYKMKKVVCDLRPTTNHLTYRTPKVSRACIHDHFVFRDSGKRCFSFPGSELFVFMKPNILFQDAPWSVNLRNISFQSFIAGCFACLGSFGMVLDFNTWFFAFCRVFSNFSNGETGESYLKQNFIRVIH